MTNKIYTVVVKRGDGDFFTDEFKFSTYERAFDFAKDMKFLNPNALVYIATN